MLVFPTKGGYRQERVIVLKEVPNEGWCHYGVKGEKEGGFNKKLGCLV